jgi:cysteine synthase B
MCLRLARKSGLLVGVSAGGAAAAALQIAEREYRAGREAVVVTILCDSAEKYMSERFWQEG